MAGNELRAVITVDAKNAAFTIDKFVGQTVGGMGQAATASKGAASAFGSLGGAAIALNQGLQLVQQAGRLAASAFDLLVGGAQRTGEQYLLLSQQTGLTVEEISAMSVAAATAGVSNEALALSTKKLSINMVDAAGGGKESTATFKALGVEIKNADGTLRNVNDVFLDTIDALGQIENESERTTASQAAFGRSSQELAALIADGSGKIREQAELAAKLGLVWSGPAAQAADELGDQTTILGLALKGMGDEIGAKSIPSMTQLVSATNDWIVKNREAISQNIDRIFAAAATAADALADSAHGVGEAIDDVVNSIPGLRGSLGTIKDLAVEWLDLQVQAQKAAKATDDTGRAFIAASEALTKAKEKQADYNLAIRDAGHLYPDQIAKQKALDQAVRDAQAAYDAAEAALDRNVTTTQQAASATDFLVSSLATLKDKSTLSAAAQAQFAKDVGISVEEVKRLDEGGKPTAETIQKIATATGKTTAEIERALPGQRSFADGMKKTDDEAIKTAQSLAQLAGQSAQYAQSQLQQAAATGNLTATTDAYVEAMAKAGEAYQASQKAADAAAAAGKSATEVAAMRTQAEQQLSTAVNAAAASQATAYAREEAAQSSLAHALGQSAIAHDMQALSMANANEVADAYGKTLVDIAAELKRTTDEINSKRGVTLTAAEADKLLADANEKAAQQISAAGAAAVQAAGKMSEFAQSVQAASDRAAQAFADLATRIVTGSVSFKDAGKAAAQIFLNAFQDVLSDTLGSVFKSAFDSLLGLGGGGGGILGGLLSGLGAKFASEIPNVIGPSIAAAGSNQAVLQGALQFGGSTASSMAGSLGSALATAGPLAAVAVGAGIFVDGIRNMVSGDMEKGLMEAAIAVPVVGVPAIIVSKLLDAFGVTGPDMRKRIAVFVETQLTQALSQDTNYLSALETGLTPLGIAITPALVQTLAGASRQNDALRAQAAILADQYGADFMAGFSPAFTASINKHGASSASVPVSDWIRAFFPDADAASQAYAQELAKSLASVEVASMGLTGADAITYTEQLAAGYVDLAQKQGLSIDQFVAMLEVQNQAAGMSTQFLASLDQLNAGLSTQKGALDEVAAGISAAFGVPVSGSNLVDMFIQVAGATGDAGKAAEIFTAKIQAMAAEDPALRALVDSMDPPLVDALHAVEDGAAGAAAAFRDLVGTVAADLTNVVDAANLLIGNVSFEGLTDQLASLKDQLAHTDDAELSAKLEHDIAAVEAQLDALSPKVDVINSQIQDSLRSLVSAAEQDGTLAVDEFTAMLQELQILATLPAGTVSDSTQALIDQIIAQFQVALKLTDEQVADLRAQIEAGGPIVPPEVVTPPVDQDALDAAAQATGDVAGNSEDAAAAQQQLAAAAGDVAAAVSGSTDEFAALAKAAGMSSDQVQAALAMVVGTVDDGKSLEAVAFKLDSITQFLPAELVPAFQGSFDSANASVSSTFTKVGELQSALTTLAGNYDITVTTHYVTDGEPPTTPTPDTGHAAGHWTVPGPQGAPYRTTVHGGEEVLSVEQSRDYRRTMRERALDGLDAREPTPVVAAQPEARAPAVGDVAGEVVSRLTQGGRLMLLALPQADYATLRDSILLRDLPQLSRAGAIRTNAHGVIVRDTSRPGG